MSKFLNKRMAGLEPYVPGEQPKEGSYIKLNTNENPYPPSPMVQEAINCQEVESLKLYSDPDAMALLDAICQRQGVRTDQVVAGNGSDEVLAFSFLAFDHEEGICFPSISYGFYKVFAELFQVPPRAIPLDKDMCIDLSLYEMEAGTVLIANPNAPTGIALGRDVIENFVQRNPNRLVIVDEAYVDFGAESCVPLIHTYDNILVIQTCSKSRSLAGGRIGYAIGNKELIKALHRIKNSINPYNVNRLSILAGAASMRDEAYFKSCVQAIVQTREEAKLQFKAMGFDVLDSKANFLFVSHTQISGKKYFEELRRRGILVRHWEKPRIKDFIRITVGTPEQMQVLYEETASILLANKGEL